MAKLITHDDKLLYIRFVEALKERGLDLNTVLRNWYYCGNDKDENGALIFNVFFPKDEYECPEKETHCICGARITHNYYVTDGKEQILVVGKECITRFLDFNMGKVCSHCKGPHKNRADNYCNTCRQLPSCVFCNSKGSTYCNECKRKREEITKKSKRICFCGQPKDEISLWCYKCVIKQAEYEIEIKKRYPTTEVEVSKCSCGKKKKKEYPRCYDCQMERNKRYSNAKN
jgi:hypothetical protein